TESLYGRSGAYSRDEALHLIRHRADAGDAEAQFELARAYEKGIGVSQNGALASKYYQKATDQGHAKAAYYRGDLYAKGKLVPMDKALAKQLYEISAQNGYDRARKKLAVASN